MAQFDTTYTSRRTGHQPSPKSDDPLDMRIFQLRMYLKQVPVNLIVSAVNVLIVTVALWSVAPRMELLIWSGAITAFNVYGLTRWFIANKRSRANINVENIVQAAFIRAAMLGVLWGSLAFFAPLVPELYQMMIIIVLVSMAAGASAVMAAIPEAAVGFIICTLMPFVYFFFSHNNEVYSSLGVMAVIFAIAALSATRAVFKMVKRQFLSEQENTHLLEDFEEAREQWMNIASMAEAFALYNRDGHLLLWNQKYTDLISASPDTIFEGARHEDILRDAAWPYGSDDDWHSRHEWIFAQLYLHTEPNTPIIQKLSNGSWVQVMSAKSDNGHLIMSYVDVTELKGVEEHLRQSELRLARAQKLAGLGSWYMNFETGENQWSDEMYALLGLDPQGKKACPELFKERLVDEDKNRFINLMERDKTQMKSFDGRINIENAKGGTIPVRYQVEIDFGDDGQPIGAVATLLNISNLLEAERRIMQAQKNESIGVLSRGISHDLNNLLSVIIGNADIIADDKALDPKSSQAIVRIMDMAEKGNDLIGRLMATSSQQDLYPEYIEADSFIEETLALLAHENGPDIHLHTDFESAGSTCYADPNMLRPGLTALVLNARDSMPAGGKLTVKTTVTTFETAPKGLLMPAGNYLEISVTDTGHGIDPRIMPRVFEPFFSTKDVGTGHGLGLSILHGFARQSQGGIRIASTVGRGTTVSLYLPIKAAEKVSGLLPEDVLADIDFTTTPAKVLVVEDEPALLDYIENSLSSLGYTPVCVSDGWQALNILDKDDAFDMLITDVVLPKGLNGWDLAKKVQKNAPHIKVLFISGYTRMALSSDHIMPENVEFLSKPFRKKALSQAMEKILRKA